MGAFRIESSSHGDCIYRRQADAYSALLAQQFVSVVMKRRSLGLGERRARRAM
jgi:hypothetical protein